LGKSMDSRGFQQGCDGIGIHLMPGGILLLFNLKGESHRMVARRRWGGSGLRPIDVTAWPVCVDVGAASWVVGILLSVPVLRNDFIEQRNKLSCVPGRIETYEYVPRKGTR
jgi:hypothetical protein